MLDGLGFAVASYEQPVATLTGGEQNRLMLAKLLLAEPDLMLLDEPSNHLDIEATEWLEDFLVESRSAMIVVSHDRYFLDKVTNRTLELFRGTVDSYPGNFSAYWRQKAERLLVQRRTYEKQQNEIAKTEDFIRRNHYGRSTPRPKTAARSWSASSGSPPPREIVARRWAFRRVAHRRHRAPRRGAGKALRPAAVRRPHVRHPPRRAVGHSRAQRLRQDDAAALPARASRAPTQGRVVLGTA